MGWKEETLFDVQTGSVELGGAEKKIVDLVGRAVAGGVIVVVSVSDLLVEVMAYRRRRSERKGILNERLASTD